MLQMTFSCCCWHSIKFLKLSIMASMAATSGDWFCRLASHFRSVLAFHQSRLFQGILWPKYANQHIFGHTIDVQLCHQPIKSATPTQWWPPITTTIAPPTRHQATPTIGLIGYKQPISVHHLFILPQHLCRSVTSFHQPLLYYWYWRPQQQQWRLLHCSATVLTNQPYYHSQLTICSQVSLIKIFTANLHNCHPILPI